MGILSKIVALVKIVKIVKHLEAKDLDGQGQA